MTAALNDAFEMLPEDTNILPAYELIGGSLKKTSQR